MKATRVMLASVLLAALATQAAAQRRRPVRPVRPVRSRKDILTGLEALAAANDRVEIKALVAKPRGEYMRFAVSSGLRHYAYIGPFERGKPAQLVIDGVERGDKRVYAGKLFFLGGTAIAGIGRRQGPFVVNGKLWPHTGENSAWLASPDNKRIAHVVGGWEGPLTLVVDGKVVLKAPRITGVGFSPDSKRLVFVVGTELLSNGRWREWLSVNGERTGPYYKIGDLQFSPDSKRVAWEANAVIDGKIRGAIVLDGKVIAHGRTYNGIRGFDAKGRLYYRTADNYSVDNHYVIDARNAVKKTPGIAYLSPDGKRIAFVVQAGPKSRRLVVDGKAQTPYTAIQHVTFAPVGDSIAYIASNDGKTHLAVVDDKVVATSKGFEYPIFSPNGKRVAFIAYPEGPRERNKRELIIDGKGYPAAAFRADRGVRVRFSADGKHWMAVALHGKTRADREFEALWDGKSIGRFERMLGRSLLMTHDGKPVFAALKSRTSVAVYVGDKSGPTYERVVRPIVSDSGRRVAYAAKDADGVCAVVLDGQTFTVPAMPMQVEFIDADTLRAFFPTYSGYALVDFKAQGAE